MEQQNCFVFVDLQGFKTCGNKFLCKEFCLISPDDEDSIHHTLLKSPFEFKKLSTYYKHQANWLTSFCHGLTFDCGDVDINDFLQATYPKLDNKTVVVKGDEKVKWLKQLFGSCGDIECINIEELGIAVNCTCCQRASCQYHESNTGGRCALSIALNIKQAFEENL